MRIYIFIHLFLNLPPTPTHPLLQVAKEHQVELPVLYTNFSLANYFTYGNAHVSMHSLAFCTEYLNEAILES